MEQAGRQVISAPIRRIAIFALIGLALLALGLYGPRIWTQYTNRRLERMSIAQLEALVRGKPSDLQARYRLGLAYAREDRYGDATHEFLRVLDRDPVRADVLNDLGVAYLFQRRYYECLVALEGALKINPRFGAAKANMGRLHLATKMPFTAKTELEDAVKLEPDNIDFLCDLGEAYSQTRNHKSSESSYQRVLQLEPGNVRAHVGLGKAYFAEARYPEAERELRAALKTRPNDPMALVPLGQLKMNTASGPQDLEAARELLLSASRADPGDPEALFDIARTDLQLHKPDEAVEMLRRALTVSPANQGVLHLLERALRAAGRTADADRTAAVFRARAMRSREKSRLEEVAQNAPNDWETKIRLAELYLESAERGLAALLIRQIQDQAPNDPRLPALMRELNRQTAASGGM